MKKIAPLALMLIVCIFLTACGDAKKVEAEIKGNTFVCDEEYFYTSITFKGDGTYVEEFYRITGYDVYTGTYEVKKDAIVITDTNGEVSEFAYTYNKDTGRVKLTRNDSWVYEME